MTSAEHRLPLSDVPGYAPDGLVWVEWDEVVTWASPWWGQFDSGGRLAVADTEVPYNPRRDDCALVLDTTGAASLARAVAARAGLDVSGGVVWNADGAGLRMTDAKGRAHFWRADTPAYPGAIRGLQGGMAPVVALAIVARAVLT